MNFFSFWDKKLPQLRVWNCLARNFSRQSCICSKLSFCKEKNVDIWWLFLQKFQFFRKLNKYIWQNQIYHQNPKANQPPQQEYKLTTLFGTLDLSGGAAALEPGDGEGPSIARGGKRGGSGGQKPESASAGLLLLYLTWPLCQERQREKVQPLCKEEVRGLRVGGRRHGNLARHKRAQSVRSTIENCFIYISTLVLLLGLKPTQFSKGRQFFFFFFLMKAQ